MIEKGRILRIYRDGRKHERELRRQLPTGAQANLETLAEMRKIVLADAAEEDLRNYAFREIIGFDKTSLTTQIDAIFTYCRDRIIYEPEQAEYETVADMWSAIYALNPKNPVGDCAVKSVVLATCLSYLNLKPRFTVLQQIPRADFFNHVFVTVMVDGKELSLDPTPSEFRPGDELEGYWKGHYHIFEI